MAAAAAHLALRRILNNKEEDLAVLRLLLTHHADPNRRDLRGRTALEAAIEWGCSEEAVEALREASESAATPVVEVRKAADVPQERRCGRLESNRSRADHDGHGRPV